MIKQKLTVVSLIIIALFGSAALWFSLQYGVGVSPDGAVYLSIARNLLNGNGLTTWPATFLLATSAHLPPFYPLILAFMSLSGSNVVEVAQSLNLFLFAANIFLVGWVLYQLTDGMTGFALFGAFLTMTSTGMLFVHTWAFSEPLFLFLSLSGLYTLARYFIHPQPVKVFIAATLIGMASVTRYAGLPLIFVGLTGIFIYGRSSARKKLFDSAIFLLLSLLPLVAWMVQNMLTPDVQSHRAIVYHPESLLNQLTSAGRIISSWFVGDSYINNFKGVALPVFIACLIVGGISLVYKRIRQPLVGLLILFILSYICFLAFSLIFIDAATPLDQRILIPVFVYCVVLILYGISSLLAYSNDLTIRVTQGSQVRYSCRASLPLRIALILLCLAYTGIYLRRATNWVNANRGIGHGYTSRVWQESKIIDTIRSLSEDTTIYANRPEAVYFLTGRPASLIPWKINPYTLETNPRYQSDISSMRNDLEDQGGVIVYFNDHPWYVQEAKKLKSQLNLSLERPYQDGLIFWIKPDR